MNNLETRVITDDIEVRSLDDGSSELTGYGIVFNSWSAVMGDFKERILPEALDDVDLTDVVATFNHNPNNVLGRTTAGTMSLEKNNKGVRYSIKLPNTTAANDLKENIRLGNIRGSSFTFTMKYGEKDENDTWEKKGEGYQRTIKKIDRVLEMGPVVFPAYPSTSVKLRDIIAGIEQKELEEAKAADALKLHLQQRQMEIDMTFTI